MSEINVLDVFSNYICEIPKAVYDQEIKLWPSTLGTATNNLSQIMNWYRLRCQFIDSQIDSL